MNNDTLAACWLAAKEKETQGNAERLAIEAQMVAQAESKAEGTVKLEGAEYKVTIGYGMSRTVDEAALSALWPALSEGLRRIFPVKHGLDTRELRHWQQNEPTEYALAAQAITAKPSKPSVKVEMISAQDRLETLEQKRQAFKKGLASGILQRDEAA